MKKPKLHFPGIFNEYEPAAEWIKTGKSESEMIQASLLRRI